VVARISLTVAGLFLRPPATGARPLVWLALDPPPATCAASTWRSAAPSRPASRPTTTDSPRSCGSDQDDERPGGMNPIATSWTFIAAARG
jgi:hypothetical protein